jgi:hypothetical protein
MFVMDPNELIQGTIALQQFAANAKYVEMIVDIAFAVVPTILGFGAAGLIGSAAIRTAKDVMDSISLLKNLEPMIYLGGMAARPLNRRRKETAERWQQSNSGLARVIGYVLGPDVLIKRRRNQNTQSKQEEQSGGGSGGSPPSPPDIKTDDKKKEQAKISGIPIDEYVKKKGMS